MPNDFDIRKPKASDLNFIHSTFLKSMHKETKLGKSVPTTLFFAEFAKTIDYLLEVAETIIACDKENPDVIFAYLIYEPKIVHYAFTKLAFRRLHIARDLVLYAMENADSFEYSLKTLTSKKITINYPNLTYNPFHLMKKGSQWKS
jgi:hypothetical protein